MQKMSLANIQGKLSRAEMKSIMAGSGGGGSTCTCTGSSCSNQGYQFYCDGPTTGYGGCAWMAMTRYCVGSGCGASCSST